MARMAEGRSRVKESFLGKADAREPIDAAVKDLIDNLIVPKLVEEFLRQYGPASIAEKESLGHKTPQSQPIQS